MALGVGAIVWLGACSGSSDRVPGPSGPAVWTLSGWVTGDATQGITVSLAGAGSAVTTTDGKGHYAFTGLRDGTYTVTPALAGFGFTPNDRSVTIGGADVGGQDFLAAALFHELSGQVTGDVAEGVTVALEGEAVASATTTTDAQGRFAFPGLADGTYTVTPGRAGYGFQPAERLVEVQGADVGGQDFVASAVPLAISGTVRGVVGQGVRVVLSGGAPQRSQVTGGAGQYAFAGLTAGIYVISPSHLGYAFEPASREVVLDADNVGGLDFTGLTGACPCGDGNRCTADACVDGTCAYLPLNSRTATATECLYHNVPGHLVLICASGVPLAQCVTPLSF